MVCHGETVEKKDEGRIIVREKGFTLIELLIVVAIIGILAAIAIPNFLEAQVRAKTARAYAEMHGIALALEEYMVDHSGYPDNSDNNVYIIRMEVNGVSVPILTTPIAYLKSMPESEPFPEYQDPYDGYMYWNYYADRLERGEAWGPGRDYWVIVSNGPDQRQFNLIPPYRSTYDPSNGTTSGGNIHYFGPGFGINKPQFGM